MSSDINNQNEKPKKSKLDLAKPGNAVATKRRKLKNMMEDDVQKWSFLASNSFFIFSTSFFLVACRTIFFCEQRV